MAGKHFDLDSKSRQQDIDAHQKPLRVRTQKQNIVSLCYEVIKVSLSSRTLQGMNLTTFRVYSQTGVQRSPLGNGKVI